jgi:hypothetical protein
MIATIEKEARCDAGAVMAAPAIKDQPVVGLVPPAQ